MAKLAELNGYPCTRHVLDLAYVLELSNRQQANITTIYDNMKKAVMLGQEIVSIEKIANEGFKNKTITDSQIKQLIMKGSEVYGQLRYIHQLNTHLKMVDILTPKQINLYNNLHGYSPGTKAQCQFCKHGSLNVGITIGRYNKILDRIGKIRDGRIIILSGRIIGIGRR